MKRLYIELKKRPTVTDKFFTWTIRDWNGWEHTLRGAWTDRPTYLLKRIKIALGGFDNESEIETYITNSILNG